MWSEESVQTSEKNAYSVRTSKWARIWTTTGDKKASASRRSSSPQADTFQRSFFGLHCPSMRILKALYASNQDHGHSNKAIRAIRVNSNSIEVQKHGLPLCRHHASLVLALFSSSLHAFHPLFPTLLFYYLLLILTALLFLCLPLLQSKFLASVGLVDRKPQITTTVSDLAPSILKVGFFSKRGPKRNSKYNLRYWILTETHLYYFATAAVRTALHPL